jgi:acetyl-CoA carboxylase carboxyltransferase component
VQAVFGGRADDPAVADKVEQMRDDYEQQLDAKYAGARGHVDVIVTPEETRDLLAFACRIVSNYDGPHLGAFILPEAAP